ncbi:MAG: helix-turn-helix domain-containing protein [Planctomycetota bacterium]|nr:helix-turn-helix domain-containing protein [Planctomycetota bacterium]
MQSIPLIRASQLVPFVQGLGELDLPVAESLARAHIPAAALGHPDMLIPALPLYTLLGTIAEEHGIADLGFRIAQANRVEAAGRIGRRVASARTLEEVLRTFVTEIRGHSTIAAFWLMDDGEDIWFCRRGLGGVRVGAWEIEQYVVASMIQLIRLVQPDWRPQRVHLQTAQTPGVERCDLLAGATVVRDREATAIAIPRVLLGAATVAPRQAVDSEPAWSAASMPVGDFMGSLKAALTPYVLQGYPDVKVGAELAGTSVRTLQRRLTAQGCSYSEVIAAIRFDLARTLLRDRTLRIMDVARQLGYSAPGHFTRAFQRWAGMTPRAWRRTSVPV